MSEELEVTEVQPAWYIDDALPGVGPRPDWMHEKFKSMADLAKSYSALEKKVGTVPEDYDFGKSKYLDPDYAHFQDLKKLAKDKRVPAEFLDKMVDSLDKYMDEFSTDLGEELQKLGDNAKDRLATLDNWAKANLSQASYDALTGHLNTAESIQALEELRGRMMSTTPQVPNGNTGTIHNEASLEDIKQELALNLDKYKTDEKYRRDLQGRLEVASKNAPGFIDKIGA